MTVTPKIITKAVKALAKWEDKIRDSEAHGTAFWSMGMLRKMAGDMQMLRLELMASDARESRDDPSVRRRRAKTRTKGRKQS